MKNLKATALSLLCASALLTGCSSASTGTTTNTAAEGGSLQVVTTNFAAYDFARAVAGDLADISILLPPGTDAHSYEPSPADIIKIDQSDLFLYLGSESDTWVDTVLSSVSSDVNAVRMMDAEITLVAEDAHDHDHDEEEVTEDDHDHDEEVAAEDDHDHDHDEEVVTEDDHDHDHDEEVAAEDDHDHDHDEEESTVVSSTFTDLGAVTSYDEHVWTSPSNAAAVVLYYADAFAALDPDNADTYHANAEAYAAEITAMGNEFTAFFETVSEKLMVVGDRFPLKYFANEYGIEYYAAFPGCSTETEPSAATMAYLIDLVNDRSVETVYYIEFSNGLVSNAISESTGAQTAEFHSCENFTQEEIDSGLTYVDLMYQNLETLQATMA
ncbi:metal ABC transporter substrate-binding protein [Bengtsoniella intestinalis]|uniref:metal ABC transporter substrate-binding protein n=1 Tax=Bengtsoniella intestinalis TaxID=3073143 RepID=UPI00391F43BE